MTRLALDDYHLLLYYNYWPQSKSLQHFSVPHLPLRSPEKCWFIVDIDECVVFSANWRRVIEYSKFIANPHVNWIIAAIFLVDGFKIIF